MSAIAGIWNLDGAPLAGEACKGMLHALEIYGADRSAFLADGPVAMGSHLLRLLPEDRWDAQPLPLRSERGWLVADARIDNRDELARALGISPEVSSEMADSAFVLEAWERWGEDSLHHLIGAFTFAVWQPGRQHLFLARDHVGARSLYICRRRNVFAFASMPKGLLTLHGEGSVLDEEMLACYLALIPLPAGRTVFRDLQSLPQGHCLSITPQGIAQRQYWHPASTPPLRLRNDAAYIEAFRECFDEAVRCRLRTTGSIGAELSGGLDSSSVAATAARLLGEKGRMLTAFTHVPRPGFQTPAIENRFGDEGPYAAEVATLYPNIEHVLVPNGQIDVMQVISSHLEFDGLPMFNPTNTIWLDSIMDEARSRGVTALLTGRTGNGTISYDGYISLSDFFRTGHWLRLARTALALRRNGFTTVRKVGGVTLLPLLPLWMQKRVAPRIGDFDLEYCVVNPDFARQIDLVERARIAFNLLTYDVRSDLNAFFVVSDFGDDNASCRAGWHLDANDPTGDKRIFEFTYSLPIDQFVRDGWTRSFIRRAMKGLLPDSTLQRSTRGLQAADWHESMADALPGIRAEIARLERSPLARRILDLPRMLHLTETWPTAGFHTAPVQFPYHYALSRGLGVGAFVRHHAPDIDPER